MAELDKNQLDLTNGIPLYRQISAILEDYIKNKKLTPGDILPSESDLIKIFDVSRITARLALEHLESIGLVSRKQGKGTFFSPKVKIDSSKLYSFTQEIEKLGFEAGTQLLDLKIERSKPRITDIFGFDSPQNVLKVIRLRTASNQPIGICNTYLNLFKFPELRFQDYKKISLYEIIEKDLNLVIVKATQTVMARIAFKEEAHLLKLKEGSPVVKVTRTTYVSGNIPVDTTESIWDGKTYYYNSELYRGI